MMSLCIDSQKSASQQVSTLPHGHYESHTITDMQQRYGTGIMKWTRRLTLCSTPIRSVVFLPDCFITSCALRIIKEPLLLS